MNELADIKGSLVLVLISNQDDVFFFPFVRRSRWTDLILWEQFSDFQYAPVVYFFWIIFCLFHMKWIKYMLAMRQSRLTFLWSVFCCVDILALWWTAIHAQPLDLIFEFEFLSRAVLVSKKQWYLWLLLWNNITACHLPEKETWKLALKEWHLARLSQAHCEWLTPWQQGK